MPSYTIVATPGELDASDGWWKWVYSNAPSVNVNSADKWLRPAGYVAEEVKRALRRSKADHCVGWKRGVRWPGDKHGPMEWKGAPLPAPTLDGEYKRLSKAVLEVWEWNAERNDDGRIETFTGPRAAEQYVRFRRAELGLSNEWPSDEPADLPNEKAA